MNKKNEHQITCSHTNANWYDGKIDDYTFCAKLFEETSDRGINKGKVSKLEMRDSSYNVVCNYERGWDIRPKGEALKVFKALLHYLEKMEIQ
jgi:hypothetical protein